MLKIIGVILVCTSCTAIGYIIKLKYKQRLKNLENFKNIIKIFENEIRCSSREICDAAKKASLTAQGTNDDIFTAFCNNLCNSNGSPLSEIWRKSVSDNSAESAYTKEDIEMLKSFGDVLGSGDVQTQLKNIENLFTSIEEKTINAGDNLKKNGSIVSKIGIYAGVLISVILF